MDDSFDAVFDSQHPANEPVNDAPEEVIEIDEGAAEERVEKAPEPAPEIELDDEEKRVPLAALIDTRLKLKERDQRIAELEAAQKGIDQKPQVQAPDPYDDPDGYAAHHAAQIQQALLQQKFEFSKMWATQDHGEGAVEAAILWAAERAKTEPHFEAQAVSQAHPVNWVVEQHKRHVLAEQVLSDPDEYVRRRAAELGLISASPTGATTVSTTPHLGGVVQKNKAPRSLANAGSATGGTVQMNEHDAFDATFDPRKRK